MSEGRHTLNTDGASLGNPGHGGAGAVLIGPGGDRVFGLGAYLGRATNNVAEYRGLILGLEKALELGVRRLDVIMDSELAVRQLSGAYRVANPGLRPLYLKVKGLLAGFEDYTVRHVLRAQNAEADRLAGEAARLGKAGALLPGALLPADREAP
ncbi:MAG: ribonuclease HI family protein [Deltaproteobacteria bacterium]|nr:ribonuclease HI family protein [Deltaproteobacteria bacterium]